MSALDWDHNAYYHRLIESHLPRPCGRVLDVGCGAGAFAAELAARAGHVDALDRSPVILALLPALAQARARLAGARLT
jgi:ubiquinone/menaquinone biosynthesis C-methylase UbiE